MPDNIVSKSPKERVVRPPIVCEHFRKLPDGNWESTSITDIRGPIGTVRVQPGTLFKKGFTLTGADVVGMLEENCSEKS